MSGRSNPRHRVASSLTGWCLSPDLPGLSSARWCAGCSGIVTGNCADGLVWLPGKSASISRCEYWLTQNCEQPQAVKVGLSCLLCGNDGQAEINF